MTDRPMDVAEVLRRMRVSELTRRRLVGIAAGGLIGVVTTRVAGAAPGAGARGMAVRFQADATTLVIADNMASGGLWLTFDPSWFYEINPLAAMNMVYEPLYHLPDPERPDLFEPLLADGMPETSADGTEVTIKLRPGVTFQHTGTEMTATDWVFTLNRAKNLKGNPAFLATDYWDSVEAVDPLTLRFTLGTPNPALVPILSIPFLGVLDSAAVMEQGATDAADAAETDTAQEYLNENSHGTGPFTMAQWDVTGEVILERNEGYWGEAPVLARLIWRNIEDANSQLQAVQAGEVDIAYSLDPDAAAGVKDDPSLQVLTSATLAIEYLAMNQTEEVGGPLANRDVRLAIAQAVDYDGIISGLLAGAALRPASVVPLPLPGSEEVQPEAYQTDLDAARASFAASGVGEAELTLSYGAGEVAFGGVDLETLVTKIQADVQQIEGLTITLNPMDPNTRITEFRAGALQFTISPWGPDYPDVQGYVEPFGRSNTVVANRIGYANPRVDQLLDQAASEPKAAARASIYADVQRTLIEDAPYVVLYQPVDQKPARKSVQGATAHPFYQIQLRGASKAE